MIRHYKLYLLALPAGYSQCLFGVSVYTTWWLLVVSSKWNWAEQSCSTTVLTFFSFCVYGLKFGNIFGKQQWNKKEISVFFFFINWADYERSIARMYLFNKGQESVLCVCQCALMNCCLFNWGTTSFFSEACANRIFFGSSFYHLRQNVD